MKVLLFSLCILFCAPLCRAQQYDTTPPYLKTRQLPVFTLYNTDSVAFHESVLEKGKPTIIMLFNPECGHCKEQLELLLKIPEVTQSARLVMATTETLAKIRAFSEQYGLSKYPGIYIGKDRTSFFGGYFKPRTIPVLAFYDRNGRFVVLHQGNVKKKQVLEALGK